MKNSSAYAIAHPATFSTTGSHPKLTICPVRGRQLADFIDGIAKFTAGLGTGGLVAWLTASGISALVDFAYAVFEHFTGQSIPHGVFLATSVWFVCVPFISSFTFGCLRKMLKGQAFWYIAPGLLVMLLGSADFLLVGAWQDVIEISPWLAVALTSAYGGMLCGQRLAKNIHFDRHA